MVDKACCSKCLIEKPIKEFHLTRKGKLVTHWCKECHKVYLKTRRVYLKTRGRKDETTCLYCSTKRVLGSEKCLYHIICQISANHKISLSLVESLVDKLYQQKFECYYTGKLLIPGDNLSLDHITPKTDKVNNDLSNLVWVDSSVNRIKSRTTLLTFLKEKETILVEKNYLASLVSYEDKIKILKHVLNDNFYSNVVIT